MNRELPQWRVALLSVPVTRFPSSTSRFISSASRTLSPMPLHLIAYLVHPEVLDVLQPPPLRAPGGHHVGGIRLDLAVLDVDPVDLLLGPRQDLVKVGGLDPRDLSYALEDREAVREVLCEVPAPEGRCEGSVLLLVHRAQQPTEGVVGGEDCAQSAAVIDVLAIHRHLVVVYWQREGQVQAQLGLQGLRDREKEANARQRSSSIVCYSPLEQTNQAGRCDIRSEDIL